MSDNKHWVFAYGSNMHLQDLRRFFASRDKELNIFEHTPAVLKDYELTWNYYSKARRSGAANIVAKPGAAVHGLALNICAESLVGFDLKEGHPKYYSRGECPTAIVTYDGRTLMAHIYEVTQDYIQPQTERPSQHYLNLILEAAREHELDEDYCRMLEMIEYD
jgi:hypothetical protein